MVKDAASEARKIRDRKRMALKRAHETPEQRAGRLASLSEYQKRRRAAMTPEERKELRRAVYRKYACDAYRATSAAYMQRRRRENMSAAMAERLRARIKSATTRSVACRKDSINLLAGCSAEQLRRWIELQFTEGMSWDNRSRWHIDHIIPCAAFDLTDADQQSVAFHFTNLRPLWAGENVAKSDRIPVEQKKFLWTLADIEAARKRLCLFAGPRPAIGRIA